MGEVRWTKVEQVFREAVKLDPERQRAYLEKACRGDTALQAEVRELLSADAQSGSPLSGDALDLLGSDDFLSAFDRNPDLYKRSNQGMSQRCEKGHFYDSSKHVSCPHCGVSGLDLDLGKTMPAGSASSAPRPGVEDKTQGRRIVEEGATVGLFKARIGIEPVVGWLVCVDGPDRGRDYRIRSQRNFIGRDASMDISISSDDQISRQAHASLTYDPRNNSFRLAPGESRGLTYLNGESVDMPMTLKPYDKIEIGKTSLIFAPFCGEAFQW